MLEAGKMNVIINPSGTIFNPVSVNNTIDSLSSGRTYGISDLYNHNDLWISFNHYTDFSSANPEELIEKINSVNREAGGFLKKARFLFITFGTARVYRFRKTGRIVSNCHKISASEFTSELLSVDEIVATWNKQLDRLSNLNPELKVIFTISPVRHWKDGAHGNQISKSVLFLSVEELLGHSSRPLYFPAYEIVMDDLRDYRFYAEDMLHPSMTAIEYIWNRFSSCFLDEKTRLKWEEITKITKALSHRIQSSQAADVSKFAGSMLSRIEMLEKKYPDVSFNREKSYFLNLTVS
jgi:hypothetical protein